MNKALNRSHKLYTSTISCAESSFLHLSSMCFVMFIAMVNSISIYSQNTIGLISYDIADSYDGFNLLYPHNQSEVYLIDNCGRVVHSWPDEDIFVPGNSAYITDGGHLIKCKRRRTSAVNDPIWAGGGGETVEVLSWDNQPISQFTLNDSLMRLHHDIALMPGGNILMIAWENKTGEEAIAQGRDPETLAQDKLWPEVILEWDPTMDSVVWTWNAWDHLIQDFDPSKENFGVVNDHPELIDINYDEHDGHPDWLHINAIDYNPELDQIVVSVPYFNELWIIDHSTTTEEAKGHSGGDAGAGGDLLYRWGNPKTYDNDSGDQELFFQHDVHWVSPVAVAGEALFGMIALYNNRVTEDLSTANILATPIVDNDVTYSIINGVYGPTGFERTASHPGMDGRSNSSSLSSAQLLPNDNLLICAGRWGFTYELTPENEVVWEYITPIKTGQRASQGDTTFSINNNLTFRLKRYGEDFEGFVGRDLAPGDYIEIDPDTSYCNFLITDTEDLVYDISLSLWPNPTSQYLNIALDERVKDNIQVYDMLGRLQKSEVIDGRSITIDVASLATGIFFLRWQERTIRFVKI